MLRITLLFLAVVIAIVLAAAEFKDMVEKFTEEDKKKLQKCLGDTNLAPADFESFNPDEDIADDSPKLCFFKCFYTELGFMDQDGNILMDVLDKSQFKSLVKDYDGLKKCLDLVKVIKECKDMKKVGVCYKQ